jgi:hypothetical protein
MLITLPFQRDVAKPVLQLPFIEDKYLFGALHIYWLNKARKSEMKLSVQRQR